MLMYIGIALTIGVIVLFAISARHEPEGFGLAVAVGLAFGCIYALVLIFVSIPLSYNYTDVQAKEKPLTSFSEYAGTGEGGKLVTVDSAEETVTYVQDGKIIQVDLDDSEFYDSAESKVETVQSEARHWWFTPFSIGSKTQFNFYVPSDTVDFTVQK